MQFTVFDEPRRVDETTTQTDAKNRRSFTALSRLNGSSVLGMVDAAAYRTLAEVIEAFFRPW
jgi:hypothetical protein